jgi:hypothetical protein
MNNDPRLEKFHNYKFASYCADEAEIIGLRAELKAQREMAAIFEQGQQNACGQLVMLREAHRFDGETALNNINKIMRLGAELDRVTRYANQLVVALAKDYPAVEGWQPLPDAYGMLMQIDNMTVGNRDAREACAKVAEGEMYAWDNERNDRYNQACRDIAQAIRKSAQT